LLAVVLVASLAVIGLARAEPVKLPEQYIGHWCPLGDDETQRFQRCTGDYDDPDYLIDARSFLYAETDCIVKQITPVRGGHYIDALCRYVDGPKKARPTPITLYWRISGKHLIISDAKR
jgi:hypothetical protein